MKIRDRIKSFRRVKSCDLLPNPRNWRRHPQAQQDAMRGLLAEIGFAGAALARETKDGLQLIDGHLRTELSPDQKIPVLVLDVTQAEADKLLATFDPVGKMAEADPAALAKLLAQIDTESDALAAMLKGLAEEAGDEPKDTPLPPLVDGRADIDDSHLQRQAIGTSRGVISIGRLSAFVPLENLEEARKSVAAKFGNGEDWGMNFLAWLRERLLVQT